MQFTLVHVIANLPISNNMVPGPPTTSWCSNLCFAVSGKHSGHRSCFCVFPESTHRRWMWGGHSGMWWCCSRLALLNKQPDRSSSSVGGRTRMSPRIHRLCTLPGNAQYCDLYRCIHWTPSEHRSLYQDTVGGPGTMSFPASLFTTEIL